jgi:PAS domain S-box-containing protein
MNYAETIEVLQKRVVYLERERRSALDAMELAVTLSDFNHSMNKLEEPLLIMQMTAERVRTLIKFKAIAFYLVMEQDSDLFEAYCDRPEFSGFISAEVNGFIEDETFAWILKRHKPIILSSSTGKEQVLLQGLVTPSRTRGMFVGLLDQDRGEIPDVSLVLFSITIMSSANALESFELYRTINGINRKLEDNLRKLEESERELKIHRDHLEREVVERTEELRKSEEKYRNIYEYAVEGIFQSTSEGRFLSANPALARMFGYGSPSEMVDRIRDIGSQLYVEPNRWSELINLLDERGEVHDFEAQMLKKDSTTSWVSVNARAVRNGEVEYYEGIMEDITRRKSLEAQLLHAQKMEAIGQLAGGVAHDFNNILTAIMGYGNLLSMKMAETDPLKRYVGQILKSSENAANLTKALLTFGRKQIVDLKPLDLNEAIGNMKDILSRVIGEDIDLNTKFHDQELVIMADRTQIGQVLMNFATNARDAMPRGGSLAIETKPYELTADFVRVHGFGRAGPYALVSFADTGIGMDGGTKAKIFDPFFTTKGAGRGTGLGLSIVYGIIKQHKGYITCYSEPGIGTVFKIYLPLVESKPEEAAVTKMAHAVAQGRETILLAEDNPDVRQLTKEVLEDSGYRVITARDGEEAVYLFHQYKDEVHLLVFDVVMPRKNGKEAYEEIWRVKPDIRIIYTSGYTADVIHKKGVMDQGVNFVSKPIAPDVFLKKVREVLDAT